MTAETSWPFGPKEKQRYLVNIKVAEVKHLCPVYKKGDVVVMNEPAFMLDDIKSGNGQICPFAITNIYPVVLAISRGLEPTFHECITDLGGNKNRAFIACQAPDAGETRNAHGQVVFELERIPVDRVSGDDFTEMLRDRGLPGGPLGKPLPKFQE